MEWTFRDFFKYANNQYQYHTREAYNNKITIPHVKTTSYGLQSEKYKAAKDWDEIRRNSKTSTSLTNTYEKPNFQKHLTSRTLTMATS